MTGPYPPHPDGTPPPAPVYPQYPPAYQQYPPQGSPFIAPGMPPFPVQPPPPKSRHGLVIGMFVGAVVLAVVCGAAIVGVVMYRNGHPKASVSTGPGNSARTTDDPLTTLIDYRTSHPEWLSRDHKTGDITYPMTPPAGGPHHAPWQNCMGDVYTKQIDNGNAVHSLEHGAVWITYRPNLDADTVAELASRVKGVEYMMMSPYPGLSTPVSLQAWGYQLPMSNVYMTRVDTFIARFRKTATVEPGAACSGGETS